MIKHTTVLRARYSDTDQMRTVYHGKFFEYFEEARSELMRDSGLPYTRIEEMGLFLPVIEAHATYRRPARYDEVLNIITYFKDMPIARLRLDYEVFREGETELIAEGYTIHSFVNASTGKPTRAPAQFVEAMEKTMKKNSVK